MTKFRVSTAIAVSTAVMVPAAAFAQIVEVKQTIPKAGTNTDIGVTEIIVTGKKNNRYDTIKTTTLNAWVTIRAPGKPPRDKDKLSGSVNIREGQEFFKNGISGSAKVYKLSFKYIDPQSPQVANARVSPIKICNDKLNSLSGNARKDWLRKGGNIPFSNAYTTTARQSWRVRKKGSVFQENKSWTDTAAIRAIIKCQRLEGPKPRKKTSTKGSGKKPPVKKLQPTIKKATLRASPMAVETIRAQRCPTKLRLVGFIETRRAFEGNVIFFGPAFLTPKKPVKLTAAGTRNLFAVRDLKWSAGGAKSLSIGAPKSLRSQNITLKMSISNRDGKAVKVITKNVKVTCSPLPAPSKNRPSSIKN